MTKTELKRIQVYEDDDEEIGEYVAVAHLKDLDELEILTGTELVVVDTLDWIIIKSTTMVLYTLGIRYRVDLRFGRK